MPPGVLASGLTCPRSRRGVGAADEGDDVPGLNLATLRLAGLVEGRRQGILVYFGKPVR